MNLSKNILKRTSFSAIFSVSVFLSACNGTSEKANQDESSQAANPPQAQQTEVQANTAKPVVMLTSQAELTAGQEIFTRNCVACHGQKGEGMVGPNLTDHNWIHGGDISHIYKVIKNGVVEKGMAAWEAQLSEDEMLQVASYVSTLRENPVSNGKAPQGDLFLPASAECIYVTNEDSGELSILSAGTLQVIKKIAVGRRPRGVRVSPDGRKVYVALSGSPKCPPSMSDEECEKQPVDKTKDGIAEIDVATRKMMRVLPGGSDPEQFDISPDGSLLYISNEDADMASIVNLRTGKLIKSVPVSKEPEGVKTSPDGSFFYVTGESDHEISVVDAKTHAVIKKIAVGKRPRDIVFSKDGKKAYVSGELDGTVTVIDPATHEVMGILQLPEKSRPMGLALSADNSRLFVANGRAGTVSEINLKTAKVVRSVTVGKRPWGLAISTDGQRLYTANGPSNTISVINTNTFQVTDSLETGSSPWGVAVGPNPTVLQPSSKVASSETGKSGKDPLATFINGGDAEKGKILFNGTLGCAHCHGTNAVGHTDNRNLRYAIRRYGQDTEKVITQVLKEGRKGTAMPPWNHLNKKQLGDIKAFLATIQEPE